MKLYVLGAGKQTAQAIERLIIDDNVEEVVIVDFDAHAADTLVTRMNHPKVSAERPEPWQFVDLISLPWLTS